MNAMMQRTQMGASSSRCNAFVASIRPPTKQIVAPARMLVVDVEAKLKTRKSAAKRFKVTNTGKVMGRHAGKQHFQEKKSSARNNFLSKSFALDKTNIRNAIKCMPYAGISGK